MVKYLLYVSYQYGFPVLRPLIKEIKKRGAEVTWFVEHTNSKREVKNNENALQTIEEVVFYEPDIVIAACNEVPHFISGLKVQLFHGFNVKKRSNNRGHFRIRGFFDLYCTQGPSTTKKFEQLAKKHKYFDVIETGWPKVDVLFPVKEKKKSIPVFFYSFNFYKIFKFST